MLQLNTEIIKLFQIDKEICEKYSKFFIYDIIYDFAVMDEYLLEINFIIVDQLFLNLFIGSNNIKNKNNSLLTLNIWNYLHHLYEAVCKGC